MHKKILLVVFAAIFLSGCTLFSNSENAATDTALPSTSPESSVAPTPTLAPTDINEISSFEKSQVTSTSSDIESIEKDLNSTIIPEENLNDILY